MKKKILSLIVTATLLITVVLPVCAYVDDEDIIVSKRLEQNVYHDISADKWYAVPVMKAKVREIMWGIGSWTFAPDTVLTREMAIAVLYRIEFGGYEAYFDEKHVNSSDITIPFDDVKAGAWYTQYVIWAAENEIVMGIGNNKFGVGNEISREELTTIIDRYLKAKDLELAEKTADAPEFNDEADVSDWATDSLDMLYKGGVITGDDNGNFRPKDYVTRAEAAAVFVRLDNAFAFDISHLLDFADEDVGSVKLTYISDSGNYTQTITDSAEIARILENLRKIKISFSRSTPSMTGRGGNAIGIYDKNGDCLFGKSFTPSSFGTNGGRYYYFDADYLQEYYDMLVNEYMN